MVTHDEDAQRTANCRVVEDVYAALDALDVERALAPFAEDAVFEMLFAPPPIPERVEAHHIAIFAEELGFDRERIRNRAVAQVVLSAWWSLEDHGYGWEPAIVCAEILARLRL